MGVGNATLTFHSSPCIDCRLGLCAPQTTTSTTTTTTTSDTPLASRGTTIEGGIAAGVGVGATVGCIIFCVLVILFAHRRTKKQQRRTLPQDVTAPFNLVNPMFVGSPASTQSNAYEIPVSTRTAEEESAHVAPLKEGSNRAAPGYEYMPTTQATYDLRPKALGTSADGDYHDYSYVAPPRQTSSDDGYIEPDWNNGDAAEYTEPTRSASLDEAPTYMAMERGSGYMVPSATASFSPEEGTASDTGNYMDPLTEPAPPAPRRREQSGKYDKEAHRLPQQGAYDIEPRRLPQQGPYDTQASGSHYALQPAQPGRATLGATNVNPQVAAVGHGWSARPAREGRNSYDRLQLAANGPLHDYAVLAQPGKSADGSQAYTALLTEHSMRPSLGAEPRNTHALQPVSSGATAWPAGTIDDDTREVEA